MSPDQEFEIIKKFEKENQNIFDKEKPFNTYRSKKITYGSKEHLQNLKDRFLNERQKDKEENNINKKNKQVIPDAAIYQYIKEKYDLDDANVELVKKYHNIAMDTENKLGHFLEEFIYSKIKLQDWIWCSGSILRSIDFIKQNKKNNKNPWLMLQIKNSDNSENSSSNKVRKNTKIDKWFRRFSKKNDTNWPELIKITNNKELTEDNFLKFLKKKAKP